MDTLFRLVSLQQQSSSDPQQQYPHQSSFNSSTTSRSSSHHYNHRHRRPHLDEEEEEEEEECNNLYMDEDHFSSSSSSSKHPPHLAPPPAAAVPVSANFEGGWASELLTECARAVAARDTETVQRLMWTLNELSSPYGDAEQKVASYFLQALFARLTSSGPRTLRTLSSASDRSASFDSARRVALRSHDLTPWSSFGHVASNGAILETFLLHHHPGPAPARLRILDLGATFCTQWPTLLEALATRSASDDTPHLSLTTVIPRSSPSAHRVTKELSARIEKFARLMGVPFAFDVLHHPGDLSSLDLSRFHSSSSSPDDPLAVNLLNSLHSVPPSRRAPLLSSLRRLRPQILTLVEEHADLSSDDGDFLRGFTESLRYFSAYFDSLDESFPRTSNERLALERAAGRAVVDLVACPAHESAERRETSAAWSARMRAAGFVPAVFSDDVADDVRALLRRYREGWAMRAAPADAPGVQLTWKEQPVVWASAWKL